MIFGEYFVIFKECEVGWESNVQDTGIDRFKQTVDIQVSSERSDQALYN